jgi:hypothetical protein
MVQDEGCIAAQHGMQLMPSSHLRAAPSSIALCSHQLPVSKSRLEFNGAKGGWCWALNSPGFPAQTHTQRQ